VNYVESQDDEHVEYVNWLRVGMLKYVPTPSGHTQICPDSTNSMDCCRCFCAYPFLFLSFSFYLIYFFLFHAVD